MNAEERPLPRDVQSPPIVWLLMILIGLMVVFWWQTRGRISPLHDPNAVAMPVVARGDLADDEKATIALFQKASPSVVNITSLARRRDALRMNAMEVPQGTGSGFIWSDQGYIVTNFHVIKDAQAAQVTLADRSNWDARLVGVEPDKDIAVLKIEAPASQMIPVLRGESANLAVGQKVFAIGNPFGLDQTLTTGVISGLGREIQSVTRRPIQDVIQTNAAINPGNSGGPLLDSAARVIGMNTAIYSPTGSNVGIGFAVPMDTISRIVPQLIRNGKVERIGLGISLASDQIPAQLGLTGVLVMDVVEGGGAAKAGIRPTTVDEEGDVHLGDIIIEINGASIQNSNDLYRAMQSVKAGDQVKAVVQRGDKTVTLQVTAQVLK